MADGHLDAEYPIARINQKGVFRRDLGDIGPLAESLGRLGLLTPIVVTPDGDLICGKRRLAAADRLGWASVPCWIPEQISPQLRLFALFDDQALRKTLTPIEQASLYGEYQQLYAAQAKLRQQATRFGHDKTTQTGAPGSGESPEPSAAMSRNGNESRVRAAIAVTGTDSHQRLEQIRELQVIAADVDEDPFVRDDAAEALAGLNQDGKVNPRWRQVKLSQQRARQDQAAANPGPPPEPADPHAIQKRQARLLGDLLRREHGWWHRYNPETFARFAEPDAWQLAVTYRAGVDTFMDTATLARTTR